MTSTVHHQDDQITLHLGDCLDVLPTLPDNSIDAVVCDPPYGLANLSTELVLQAIAAWMAGDRTHVPDGRGFMSAEWDRFVPPPGAWDQCWRVLKPGGHLLAFAAPRTQDLMGLSIRIAGFEIRDSIHWVFGSGFPKGQDIGKSIDRRRDDRADVLRVTAWLRDARDAAGWSTARIDALFGFNGMGSHWTATASKAAIVPTLEQWTALRGALGFDDAEILPIVEKLNARKGDPGSAWLERPEADYESRPGMAESWTEGAGWTGTTARAGSAVLDAAKRWEGWNTQLKPAHQPIIVARKSTGFNTTVANVLEHGTGALNIGACRTPGTWTTWRRPDGTISPKEGNSSPLPMNRDAGRPEEAERNPEHPSGRWPTNLVLTHSPDCEQVGERTVRGDSRSGQERGSRPGGFGNVGADGGGEKPNGTLHGPEVVAVFRCGAGCPVAEMDRQSGVTSSSGGAGARSGKTGQNVYGDYDGSAVGRNAGGLGDSGGASRFFSVFKYEAKAPAHERPRLADGTAWPTVKPIELMRWLVRLVTPPGGTILDPFCGTGATGEAAIVEGFRCVLVEKDPAAAELAMVRLAKPLQPSLFGEVA